MSGRTSRAASSESSDHLVADGNADLNGFYRRHAPAVFRFALYLSGERSEAEDITSETFVRVWVSATKIEEATVKGYLFTIARNLYLQALKKRNRIVPLNDDLRDPQPGPYARASARSETAALQERMMRLPETDRAALLMRAMEGIPYEQIARTLNISVSSAKVKVHRARLALGPIR